MKEAEGEISSSKRGDNHCAIFLKAGRPSAIQSQSSTEKTGTGFARLCARFLILVDSDQDLQNPGGVG